MSFTAYLNGRARFEDHLKCFYDRLTAEPYNLPLYPSNTARDVSQGIRIYYAASWADTPRYLENGREEHGVITFNLDICGRSQDPVDDLQETLRALKDAVWAIWGDRVSGITEHPWENDEDEVVLPVDVSINF